MEFLCPLVSLYVVLRILLTKLFLSWMLAGVGRCPCQPPFLYLCCREAGVAGAGVGQSQVLRLTGSRGPVPDYPYVQPFVLDYKGFVIFCVTGKQL